MARDKYDEQIERILRCDNPKEAVFREWSFSNGLFAFVTEDGMMDEEGNFGCLTMIRGPLCLSAQWPELTDEIRSDRRLPCFGEDIQPTLEALNVFAEWQRRIDVYREREQGK